MLWLEDSRSESRTYGEYWYLARAPTRQWRKHLLQSYYLSELDGHCTDRQHQDKAVYPALSCIAPCAQKCVLMCRVYFLQITVTTMFTYSWVKKKGPVVIWCFKTLKIRPITIIQSICFYMHIQAHVSHMLIMHIETMITINIFY